MQMMKISLVALLAVGAMAEPTKEEKFSVARFGPEDCVHTYLSEQGTCIVETKCKEDSLDKMQMGLVCADKDGNTVRHLFGVDSFGHKEKFDSLIPCTQCLALDNFDSGKDTEEMVLKDEVNDLKTDMTALSGRVAALEAKEAKEAAPAEEKAEAKAAPAEEKAASFTAATAKADDQDEDDEAEDDEEEDSHSQAVHAAKKALKKASASLRGKKHHLRKKHRVEKKARHTAKKGKKVHKKQQKRKQRVEQNDDEDSDEEDSDEDSDDQQDDSQEEDQDEDEEQAEDDKLEDKDI